MKAQKTYRRTITFTGEDLDDLLQKIELRCQQTNVTFNTFLQNILRKELEQQNDPLCTVEKCVFKNCHEEAIGTAIDLSKQSRHFNKRLPLCGLHFHLVKTVKSSWADARLNKQNEG